MEIIVPCAGYSSRFPRMRPKFLLTDYAGQFMFQRAIGQLHTKHPTNIVVLQEHEEEFRVSSIVKRIYGSDVRCIIINQRTSGPADTVYQAIGQLQSRDDSDLLVRDCDSFLDFDIEMGNFVYCTSIGSSPHVDSIGKKSFISMNNQHIINSIVEKRVISDTFCVGGYQFNNIRLFKNAFISLASKEYSEEIYLSSIVDVLISKGEIFIAKEVDNYIDVGTASEWFRYNNKPTYFCDIDGTLIESSLDHSVEAPALSDNVKTLLEEQFRGCQLIFVTSRPEKLRQLTETKLDSLGFKEYTLLMGVHHSQRVIINDYAESNPFPTALAINLKRDSDSLREQIRNRRI